MIFKKVFFSILIIVILINCGYSKRVIYAQNTTAIELKKLQLEQNLDLDEESSTKHTSSVIVVPGNCKPGFVESAINKRCRKIAS